MEKDLRDSEGRSVGDAAVMVGRALRKAGISEDTRLCGLRKTSAVTRATPLTEVAISV